MSASDTAVAIRRAEARDLDVLGRLGASMMRLHYAFDGQRFISPGDHPEDVYARFLQTQLADPLMIVLVAERAAPDRHAQVVGYVYAGIEPASFKELRDRAGFVHDLLVADGARGEGVGPRLLESAVAWLREQGAPRVLLWTAAQNTRARTLFEGHGFKATMIEMTREL